jgi:hypothetical protein
MLTEYLLRLLLTVLVEAVLAAALARPGKRWRLVHDACLFNLVTHPAATIGQAVVGLPFLVVEMLVFGLEGVGYHTVTGLGWRRALLVSLVLNGVTTVVGVSLFAGFPA